MKALEPRLNSYSQTPGSTPLGSEERKRGAAPCLSVGDPEGRFP